MKKKLVFLIGFAVILAFSVFYVYFHFFHLEDYEALKKPDSIEVEALVFSQKQTYRPGDAEYEKLYSMIKKDWDRTLKESPRRRMLFLQQDYLNEETQYVGTAIHFIYQEPISWDSPNVCGPVKEGYIYSFFPLDLEVAAITTDKDYYSSANLPMFNSDNDLKKYVTELVSSMTTAPLP